MRLVLSAIGVLAILATVVLLRRRMVREQAPTLVQDLAAWNASMPIRKPRVIYSGTQPVDRKALARALKGTKPKRQRPVRDFKIVPDDKRRIG
jgi:hypothetical protein